MIAGGERGLLFLRVALAAVIVLDLVSLYLFLGEARAAAMERGMVLGAFTGLLSHRAVSGSLLLLGGAAAIAFALRPGRLWEGAVALLALMLLSSAHAQLFGSPWRHLFYSGLCLSGWLLGLIVSRRDGAPTDESYARTGAIALLGAAYFNAGISKLVYGGFDWTSALPIQSAVVGQDGLVADDAVSAYRAWVVNTPVAGMAFSVATVCFELAGPLMLLGRRARLAVAGGLLAMHANIYVLTPILYWESMFLLAVLALYPDPLAPKEPATGRLPAFNGRPYRVALIALFLCALVGIAHQARRYAQTNAAPAAVPHVAPVPAAAPEPQQIGPFTVGQALADSWSVESLRLSDQGVIVAVAHPSGRARFELTCADSPHTSPLDLGPAHIFYSSDLDFGDFEAAGRAVQAQLREASGGQDPCARLSAWRTSAGAAPVH